MATGYVYYSETISLFSESQTSKISMVMAFPKLSYQCEDRI